MCGITGFIDFGGHRRDEASQRVRQMADALLHRGPDEAGYYVDEHAALGHRRLSIIDLSSGQQPMAALGGQVQIVFNGEIYNFQELRAQLERAGHQFRTHSDTEVILLGYLEWGEQCVERLNGMFAFVIWDARHRQVLLARDRVGKKPLYYYRKGGTIAFASELKALRAGGFCPHALDTQALDCYFSFGYIPAPRTIYRDVKKLGAARTLLVSATSQSERRYWNLSFGQPVSRTLEDALEEFEPLLDDAVRCRMVSEVPLGAFLSGGIDSSLVVSSMARQSDRPVITNSIGFEDRELNELSVAGAIAAHLKTDHKEFVVRPDATQVLERIAWHFDEPLADSSAVPTWYVCEMARRTVTVALSGDGGDESFGGYTFRYVPHMIESKVRSAVPAPVREAVFGTLGSVWPASARLPKPLRLKTIFENLAVGDNQAYYRDLVWLRPDAREELYSPELKQALKGFTPMEVVNPYYVHNDAPDSLARSQYADIHFYMTDDVLVKVDRMSMAHSLEVRAPLLDYRIIEFAARLPADLKVRSRRCKVLLRALAARRLPLGIERLRKRGFSIPAARWLRHELKPFAESVIFDKSGSFSELLDGGTVRRMWQEHLDEQRDHSVVLWGLMMLGLWQQTSRLPMAPRVG